MIAPKATGNWRAGPLSFDLSLDLSAGSLPAKLTVPAVSWATPAPEPTAL